MNEIHPKRRKSIRLPYFDYTASAAYFLTICTHLRQLTFGHIQSGEMILNPFGKIALNVWCEIPSHFPSVELGEFVVMPNHIHGIIINNGRVGHPSRFARRRKVRVPDPYQPSLVPINLP